MDQNINTACTRTKLANTSVASKALLQIVIRQAYMRLYIFWKAINLPQNIVFIFSEDMMYI